MVFALRKVVRREARVDEHGGFVALPDQDRSRWDAGRIREGERALEAALRLGRPGPFQVQAAIAALHVQPETDWTEIAALYETLGRLAPSAFSSFIQMRPPPAPQQNELSRLRGISTSSQPSSSSTCLGAS